MDGGDDIVNPNEALVDNISSVFDIPKEIEGAWGSSSYASDVNSSANMTTDEILAKIMGPKQVRITQI